MRIARELRELPRKKFKQNLKANLPRSAQMPTTTVSSVLEFASQAFGAQEMLRVKWPDGSIMHAEFRVGDSMIEIGEANEQFPPLPATIHLKVDDGDAVYERALQAGGASLYPPTD